MLINANLLITTGAILLLVSLGLAWLASFIIYAKIEGLKKLFPATHQLIRAHIDYILMALLLFACFYLIEHFSLVIPNSIILITCFGAIYNPFGFIVLAIEPKLGNPKTLLEKARVLIGFLPATIGFGYIMLSYLASL